MVIRKTQILTLMLLMCICSKILFARIDCLHKNQDSLRPNQFQLISPLTDTLVTEGNIVFRWESNQDKRDTDNYITQYEITFWSRNRDFGKSYQVMPPVSRDTVRFVLSEFRTVFRRHGDYYWQIKAVNAAGLSTLSRVRKFTIGAPKIRKGLSPFGYFYGVQLQYHYRSQTPQFKQFLQNISPTIGFESFYELGFIFKQDELIFSFLDLQEKLFILSQIGIGWELKFRILMHKNLYFALYPQGSFSSSWFSTGIKDFTSTLILNRLGCDVEIMPKGFMTLKGQWIPDYNIRYKKDGGGLRTFTGQGWEFGLRLVLSHTIVKPFHFLGLEIDFERIPVELFIGQIKDQLTGTKIKMNRFNIIYLM